MSKVKTYTISVKEVTLGGAKCPCPEVIFLSKTNADMPCTYDKKNKLIKIEVTDEAIDMGDVCVTYEVRCKEGDCKSDVITKCLCNDDGDCGDCEACINGFCEKVCPEEQCYDGVCGDCKDDTACPCNQICRTGKCVCPDGEFKENEDDDCCIQCNEEVPCPPCFECVGGRCLPKDCGTGVCDPESDSCVDCCYDSQCGGKNEVCSEGKTCECADGYVRNVCTDECEPIGPNSCSSDKPCPEGCSECVDVDPCTGLGRCREKQCPPGFICVEGDCLPECDCSDRDCASQGAASSCADHPTLSGRCYCFDCGQNDCSNQVEGGDCGPATDRDACICVDDNCEANPCNNKACATDGECAFGCTCYQGECVSCSQFSCTEEGASACGGANSRNCQCVNGECVGGDEGDCTDTLQITRDDANCELVGLWQSESCCTCPDIAVKITPTLDGAGNISFDYTLFKGDDSSDTSFRLSDPENNDAIADTEEPTSGSITYQITNDVFIENLINGVVVSTGRNTTINATENPTGGTLFGEVDNQTQGGAHLDIGSTYTVTSLINAKGQSEETRETIEGKVYTVSIEDPFSFVGENKTGCTYAGRGDVLITFSEQDIAAGPKTAVLTSDECRPVYFLWKQDGASFRKVYVDNPYTDRVDYEKGLRACKEVTLEVDCGCERFAQENSKFCNPMPIANVSPIDSCNKKFNVSIPPACDLNGNGDVSIRIDFGAAIESAAVPSPNTYSLEGSQLQLNPSTSGIESFEVCLAAESSGVNITLECCS